MAFETVIYEKTDGIAVIKLNRPKVLNAINVQLTRDFHQALAEAAAFDFQVWLAPAVHEGLLLRVVARDGLAG